MQMRQMAATQALQLHVTPRVGTAERKFRVCTHRAFRA
jgi:hypothetical protein